MSMQLDVQQIKQLVAEKADLIHRLQSELGKAIVGQQEMISRLLVGLLTHGHVLLEGVPGLAKTTAIRSLAQALSTRFQRIQFTPDLLPADLVGTMIYVPSEGTFRTRKGPIFANFILADEINRAPSKVQSALLEAMQERQVTIGEQTFPMEGLFLVMATQNPIEQEGTYPLPEAQVDRFMLKIKITYPQPQEERKVLDMAMDGAARPIQPVLTAEEIFQMQEVVKLIYVDEQVKNYILALVQATRDPARFNLQDLVPLIDYGASPRASICLGLGARAIAFLQGRGYVTPQDVKDIAFDVLRHRVILSYEAEAEEKTPEDVIQIILNSVPVP
jgi:MoxR-like ATPase